jgi:hypothetical protein
VNLRFIVRYNKKILQQQVPKRPSDVGIYDAYDLKWEDVPLVEERRSAREWNLVEHANRAECSAYPSNYPLPSAVPEDVIIRVREVAKGDDKRSEEGVCDHPNRYLGPGFCPDCGKEFK